MSKLKKTMEKEKIERAAIARLPYSDKECADSNYVLGKNVGFKRGFTAGVQWRINSVWHKPSAYGEELKRDVEVIAKTKRGYRFGKFNVVGWFHEYIAFVSTSSLEYALSDVLEYAYLDDLLPDTRKEAEP